MLLLVTILLLHIITFNFYLFPQDPLLQISPFPNIWQLSLDVTVTLATTLLPMLLIQTSGKKLQESARNCVIR